MLYETNTICLKHSEQDHLLYMGLYGSPGPPRSMTKMGPKLEKVHICTVFDAGATKTTRGPGQVGP